LEPNPRLKILLAFTYIDTGRCRDAIPLLSPVFASEQNPAVKSSVGQRLVECHLAAGTPADAEKALTVVQKLRQATPEDPDILFLASKVYMTLWNDTFQLLIAKAPNSYQVHMIQAEALESQERFAEAANEYRQIVKIAPQLTGIHYRLGFALLRGGSPTESEAEALAAFRKELELNPYHAGALTAIGEIQLKKSLPEEAARSFSQAIQLQPGDSAARVGLAKVLISQKEWSKALEQLQAAEKLAPNDESVYYNLMLAYRGLGRPGDAKRAFEAFQRGKETKQKRSSSIVGRPAQ
jgi:tetratricopeptide (TPR) repeat protein